MGLATLRVNTNTINSQQFPSIASLTDSNFVVVWMSNWQNISDNDIYGQLFGSDGTFIGAEFRVSTNTANTQIRPHIASLTTGNFVVVWTSGGQDGSSDGVYGQLFASNGTSIGTEFQVNTYIMADQYVPSVASLVSGNFVVTWQSSGQDGSGWGLYCKLFDASATTIAQERQINTYTSGEQSYPVVTGLIGNNFVVTWMSNGQDGSGYGVYGKLFINLAIPVSSEFQVNVNWQYYEDMPSVSSLQDGNFIITWVTHPNFWGIYGRLYNSSAIAISSEFRFDNDVAGHVSVFNPNVAGLASSDFVVTWSSYGQDGDAYGVFWKISDGSLPSLISPSTTPSPTSSPSRSPSVTPTPIPSVTASPSATLSLTTSPSITPSHSRSPSITPAANPSMTASSCAIAVLSSSPSVSPTSVAGDHAKSTMSIFDAFLKVSLPTTAKDR